MAISDEDMMAAVGRLRRDSFAVGEVVAEPDHRMRVRFTITGEPGTFAIRLPLPSSTELKPWLVAIPRSADEAAMMLGSFLMEDVETNCSQWARQVTEGDDRVLELTAYGVRIDDDAEHQKSAKATGPDGDWGRRHENDDPTQTPGGRAKARLRALPYSYPEVGATAGTLPSGYHHLRVRRRLGTGRACFDRTSRLLLSWEVHGRSGMVITTDRPHEVVAGTEVVLTYLLGGRVPVDAPVRIVEVITESDRSGFSYGTLPGHPECGEERFLVVHDQDGAVYAEIIAFSRPGRWFTRLAGPVAVLLQRRATARYLDTLARAAEPGSG